MVLPPPVEAEARRLLLASSDEAGPLLWPRRPWGELAESVAERLAERGVTLRRRALAEAIEIEAGRVVGVSYVQRPDSREEIRRGRRGERGRIEVDAVVATPGWPALVRLLPPAIAEGAFRRAQGLRPVASETVHLWYSEPWPGPFLQPLDEGLQALAIDSARLHGRASELHQVTVAVDPGTAAESRAPGEWSAAAAAALARALPAMESRVVARAIALRDPAAGFEPAHERPPQRTPIPGLALAGDWTSPGLPPSIEGAVVSGRRAASCLEDA